MSMPPIERRWGGGKWPNAPKRRLRPNVRTALDLAQLGLSECFGMDARGPMTATVWCVPDTETLAAAMEVDRPDAIELEVGYGYIKHPRRTGRVLDPLFTAATHELTHAYRLQAGHAFNLAERAASEGVAMYAEQAIAAELGVSQVADYDIAVAGMMDGNTIKRMRSQMAEDDARFMAVLAVDPGSDELNQLHDAWFEFDDTGAGLPNGYLLGMHGVFSHLANGTEFSRVAKMPAGQILGIE